MLSDTGRQLQLPFLSKSKGKSYVRKQSKLVQEKLLKVSAVSLEKINKQAHRAAKNNTSQGHKEHSNNSSSQKTGRNVQLQQLFRSKKIKADYTRLCQQINFNCNHFHAHKPKKNNGNVLNFQPTQHVIDKASDAASLKDSPPMAQNAAQSPQISKAIIYPYSMHFLALEGFAKYDSPAKMVPKFVGSPLAKEKKALEQLMGTNKRYQQKLKSLKHNQAMRKLQTNPEREQRYLKCYPLSQWDHKNTQNCQNDECSVKASLRNQTEQSETLFPHLPDWSKHLHALPNLQGDFKNPDEQPDELGDQEAGKDSQLQKELISPGLNPNFAIQSFDPSEDANNLHKKSPKNKRDMHNFIERRNLNNASVKAMSEAFKPQFETYYYRDLLWKVNFSNQLLIQTPLEYERRLKLFIGRGNNSGLIRGLIKRRIWFAITDRIQNANFVWAQLKCLPYFSLQKTWKDENCNMKNKLAGCSYQQQHGKGGLLNHWEQEKLKNYLTVFHKVEARQDERFMNRVKVFTAKKSPISSQKTTKILQQESETEGSPHEAISTSMSLQSLHRPPLQARTEIRTVLSTMGQIRQQKVHNHFVNNYIIGNKKTLFKTMTLYYQHKGDYVFNYLPYTFHVFGGLEDESYLKFIRFYHQRAKEIKSSGLDGQQNAHNYWIVKPGENSNRGSGITLCTKLEEVKGILKNKHKCSDGSFRTYIVQSYIDRPLLYRKRKFDLRHYMMMTCVNGIMKGYWYRDGYVRTSSTEFTFSTAESSVHLTNDAVQKAQPQYGKYEKGNKIAYDELHEYLMKKYGFKNYDFKQIILPKMKKITADVIRACSGSIDPDFLGNNFQLFGLDFMIDADFNLWLIEVNTNPCLEISCPLLGAIIPKMMENVLELTMDCMFPPPVRFSPKGVHYNNANKLQESNRFELVYDSRIDGIYRQSEDILDVNLLKEEDDIYEDDGEEWDQDD